MIASVNLVQLINQRETDKTYVSEELFLSLSSHRKEKQRQPGLNKIPKPMHISRSGQAQSQISP